MKSLFSAMDLGAIRECFASIQPELEGQTISFILHRDVAPYLELKEPPVPRPKASPNVLAEPVISKHTPEGSPDDLKDPGKAEDDQVPILPACIRAQLKKIPVPREIFYQSNEMGPLTCYSSRLAIVEDDWLGFIGDYLQKNEVEVLIPLARNPQNDNETVILLATWVLSPFLSEDDHHLVSKIVPSSLCESCLGRQKLYLETDSLPPAWP